MLMLTRGRGKNMTRWLVFESDHNTFVLKHTPRFSPIISSQGEQEGLNCIVQCDFKPNDGIEKYSYTQKWLTSLQYSRNDRGRTERTLHTVHIDTRTRHTPCTICADNLSGVFCQNTVVRLEP